ncbi:2TM domain-containing protein [Flavobacterium mesophilum]|uniref:2TM domain-containing protein n=1 Tax=Flavobacterium mesophilum TaxID=3143495 RepID=UPI0031D0CD08
MGRFRRRMFEEYREEFENKDENFMMAYRKVKRIKGFYSHLRVYIIVNAIIIITNLNRDIFGKDIIYNGLTDWHTYSTAFWWGIALLIHAFTVFGPDVFFGHDWEQKKIQKYMDREAQNTNKWE